MSSLIEITDCRVDLESLKVVKSRSQETLCYSATVVFDGKAFACLDNDGRGGSTCFYPKDGCETDIAEMKAYMSSHGLTIEFSFDELAECLSEVAAIKRKMKKNILIEKADSIMAYSLEPTSKNYEIVKMKNPTSVILNKLSEMELRELIHKTMLK